MTDYSALGLNNYLQPLNAPSSASGQISSYAFDSNNERSSITNTFLQDASVTNAKIVSLAVDKLLAGTVTIALGIGGPNVTIDGANNRIIVNDGDDDRILIGYQNVGF